MSTHFKLSSELLGHEADVRAVAFPAPGIILSASRDCTVRAWRSDAGSPPTFHGSIISRGQEYINSLTVVSPSKDHPDGLAVSGGKDAIIEVKSLQASATDDAERLLIGHAHNICTLDVSPSGGFLISGGWDGQARVWSLETWETIFTLAGHNGMSVWSVLAIDDRTIITGCADKSIRRFDLNVTDSEVVQPRAIFHTPDIVRALCRIPANHPSAADIASASNDGVIRIWTLDGRQVDEIHGHESFIYSLTSLPYGELVSAGEDRTVRIWSGSQCVQSITHPAISVWAVASDPISGDIVTGASDGIARVFTRRSIDVADEGTLSQFNESVKSSAIPSAQTPGMNKEQLPGPDFLIKKSGTKEGQVQMIREISGNITAHQWSTEHQQWINVGTVVDAVASSGKKTEYLGNKYDYVFDVDIEDGKPPLKLPFNLSENPWDSASKFLTNNELPLSYLDKVAKFIIENTAGTMIEPASDSAADESHQPEGGINKTELATPGSTCALPQKDFLSISAAKYDAIFAKLIKINQDMVSTGRKDAALNPGQEAILRSLQFNMKNAKSVTPDELMTILSIIMRWSYSDRLPGLDILRCVICNPVVAQYSNDEHGSIVDIIIKYSIPPPSCSDENVVMMGVRALANLFGCADGRALIGRKTDQLLRFVETLLGLNGEDAFRMHSRNCLLALATTALNLAVFAQNIKSWSSEDCARLATILGALIQVQTDPEVLYRALVALGTMLTNPPSPAQTFKIREWVLAAKCRSTEDRIRAVADECLKLTA